MNNEVIVTVAAGIVGLILLISLNILGNNMGKDRCENKGGTYNKSVEFKRSFCEMKGKK